MRRYNTLSKSARCRVYRRPKALMHEEQGRLQPSRRKQPKSKVSLAGAQAFRTLLLDLSQIHLYACGVDHPGLLRHWESNDGQIYRISGWQVFQYLCGVYTWCQVMHKLCVVIGYDPSINTRHGPDLAARVSLLYKTPPEYLFIILIYGGYCTLRNI